MTSIIARRLESIRAVIADAAEKSGRTADDIRLVAVTKFHPASVVLEAVAAGLTEFGENRFQEVPAKQTEVREAIGNAADRLTWHFIGQLQSNKARKVVETFSMIQSVDRASLVERLDRIAGEEGRILNVLMQVKVSGAEDQGGVDPDAAAGLAEMISGCANLNLHGLMAIGPITENRSELHRAFVRVKKLAESIETLQLPGVRMETLSMGMSGDFDVAIEEGATLVRVGTALFGSRS